MRFRDMHGTSFATRVNRGASSAAYRHLSFVLGAEPMNGLTLKSFERVCHPGVQAPDSLSSHHSFPATAQMSESSFIPPEVDDLNEQMSAFEFVSRLAADEMKAVYLVKQKSLERRAAIKLYSPELSRSQEFRESFAATAKVTAKLMHPNLIGVYDSGIEQNMIYLVSEFVAGKPLWDSTKGEPVHLKHLQTLVEGICVGMCHAHKHGVFHGALSLKNILLDETHMPKIGGFSQASGDTSKLDPSALRFRAPEMAEEGARPTAQADIYSIGVILREMAVGQTEGVDALDRVKHIGPALKRLVQKATSDDPSKRHRELVEFHEELLDAFDPKAGRRSVVSIRKKRAAELTSPSTLQSASPRSGLASGPRASCLGAKGAAVGGMDRPNAAPRAAVMLLKPPSSAKLWIHLVVIVVLLLAIKVAWGAYQQKKARNEAEDKANVSTHEVRVIPRSARPTGQQSTPEYPHTREANDFPNDSDPRPGTQAALPKKDAAKELARLRSALSRGSRSELPPGTLEMDNRYFYYVNVPMTWDDAFWYAQMHGGHLAIPGSRATSEWMREKLVENDGMPFWLGAAKSGRHSWTLADGRSWRPRDPSVMLGEFLAVGTAGELKSLQGDLKREFVIEWSKDGRNPGSLESLLKTTKDSLATATPIYPPGTRAFGVRNYLYVPRSATWKQAVLAARAAGGNLVVIGGIAEKFNIEKLTEDADAPEGIWLGGFHLAGRGWRWTTGEPWISSDWPQGKEAKIKDSALLMRPGGGWDERSRDGMASGYVIEWSSDHKIAH